MYVGLARLAVLLLPVAERICVLFCIRYTARPGMNDPRIDEIRQLLPQAMTPTGCGSGAG